MCIVVASSLCNGACRVAVLDGGLPAWKAANLPLDTTLPSDHALSGVSQAAAAASAEAALPYPARLDGGRVKSIAQVKEALATGTAQVVDARPSGRFVGRDPEPRADLSSGHMTGVAHSRACGCVGLPASISVTLDVAL